MSFLLNYVPFRTATFFTKVSAQTLWKSVTSVRPGGRKKGRMRALKKPKDLNKGQYFGDGEINVVWPGLNTPIESSRTLTAQRYLQPDPNRMDRILALRKERPLIMRGKSLHPMERGWAGSSMQGRKLDMTPWIEAGAEELKNFTAVCIKTKMARVMMSRGRTRLFSSIVAVGNGDGLLGFADANTKDSRNAIKIALNDAPKRLQYVHRLENHTVYHNFFAQCCGVRIFVQRKPKGFGLRCHRVIQALCELCGITDLHAKVDGNARNYMNITKAFITGLMNQETHKDLAERKRLHVVEFRRENGYLPKIVASPQINPVRKNEELDKDEVLDVEDMYGEGRFPYNKPTFPLPWYMTMACPSYKKKMYDEHPTRNLEQVRVRLVAEGMLKDNSVHSRDEEAKLAHRKVLLGERPMPIGLGLPGIFRESFVEKDDEDEKK